MFSIIVCSRNTTLPIALENNIKNTIGVDYELVHIDNSENKYSIFTAYNIGISRSRYPYLCFVHEDVVFCSNNWGVHILEHLQDPETGIVGLAGADIVLRVPASWANLISPGQNIIQTDPKGIKPPVLMLDPKNYHLSKRSTVTLDGILLCMRRELTHTIKFDEQLKGFHGYDYDISLQSHFAGYKNYVIYNIKLEHSSKGKTTREYFRNLIYIYKKYEKYLPVFGDSITADERANYKKYEEKKLTQLTKKMVRKGFKTTEIIDNISYYSKLTSNQSAVRFLKIRIFLIRLFNSPKLLFKV